MGVVLVLCLAATGVFAGGRQEAAAKYKAIRFMTTETDPVSLEADAYIIGSFQAQFPDTKVFPEYITMEDAYQKAQLMATAGINPDLFYCGPDSAVELYKGGYTVAVDHLIKRIGDDFAQPILDTCRAADGKIIGVPTQTGSELFWFRGDLAKQAGLGRPTSREEILAMVTKLHTGEIYGYTGIGAVHPNNQSPFYIYTWNDGNYMFNEDASKALFHTGNREASKKILEYLLALAKHAPPGFIGTGYEDAGNDFISGRAASVELPTRLPSWVMAQNPDMLEKIDAVPLPASPGKTLYLWGGADNWVLFKNSKHKERAEEFVVHFMTGDRYAKFLHAVPMHLLPVRPSFAADPDYLANPVVSHFRSTLDMLMASVGNLRAPATERGRPLPGTGECYGSQVMAKAMNELYSGKITTDQWLDKVGEEFNRILAE
jgi:ABC-type glycerol-3-phosphate transport system substrate-binding protein